MLVTEKISDHPHVKKIIRELDKCVEIRKALDLNGVIAGGFARQALMNYSIIEYFKMQGTDIDIFFTKNTDAVDWINHRNETAAKLHVDFGVRLKIPISLKLTDNIETDKTSIWKKLFSTIVSQTTLTTECQIITDIVLPVEDLLNGFDIGNCRVAFDRKTITYENKIPEWESTSSLMVSKITTDLGYRLEKYMSRGLTHFPPETKAMINHWCALMSQENNTSPNANSALAKQLMNDKIFTDEDLIYFLRKNRVLLKSSSMGGYSDIVNADIHKTILDMRNETKNNKIRG